MKKLLSLVLAVALIVCAIPMGSFTFTASATTVTSGTTGDCTWTLDGTVLTISGNGAMGDYSTDNPAPWGTDITDVYVLDGVSSIGKYSFNDCASLANITIPVSVTSIGNCAFKGTQQKNVYISDLVAWCGVSVNAGWGTPFFGGGNLYVAGELVNDLVIPDTVTSISTSVFSFCNSITSVTIPDSVTSIGSAAFRGCFGLTSIIIPDSVTSIGREAFRECTSITSVVIPDSLTAIEALTFCHCSKLSSITIPKSVASIGENAFNNCYNLSDVWYTGSETEKQSITIGVNNAYLTDATWHYNACENNQHTYDSATGLICSVCGYERSMSDIIDSFIIDDVVLTEGIDSDVWWRYDSTTETRNEYFDYNYTPTYTITLKDGTVLESDADGYVTYNGERTKISYSDNQSYSNQWSSGTYTVIATIFGVASTFNVTLKENPVASVEINDVNLIEGVNTFINKAYNSETGMYDLEWQRYDCTPTYTITFKDGTLLESDAYGYVTYNGKRTKISYSDGQSYTNQWGVGTYALKGVIFGVSDTYTVTIEESPIKSVEINDVMLIEDWETYTTSSYNSETGNYDLVWQRYSYYPMFTITFKDGTILESDSSGYITYNGESIRISCRDDQSYTNQWGVGTYTVTGTVLGVSNTFTVTIQENPVASVEVHDVVFAEGLNQYLRNQYDYTTGKNDIFYYYNPRPAFTVTFKDGNVVDVEEGEGGMYYNDKWYSLRRYDDQSYDNQWGLGAHEVTFQIFGFTQPCTVTIEENPIESIELLSGSVFVYENANGEIRTRYDYDLGQDVKYYYYASYGAEIMNSFKDCNVRITYRDGRVVEDNVYDIIHDSSTANVFVVGTQQCFPWTLGDNNNITVSFWGKRLEIPLTVLENPVEKVVLNNLPTREFYYWGDTKYFSSASYGTTLNASDWTGISLTIYYKDGTQKTINSYNEMMEHAGYISIKTIYCDENKDATYTAAFDYLGHEYSFDVNVRKSPVESIEVLNKPENINFVRGYAPSFSGTQIQVNYTDGTNKTFELNDDNAIGFSAYSANYEIGGYHLAIRNFDTEDEATVTYLGATCSIGGYTRTDRKEISDVKLENVTHNGLGMKVLITHADSTTQTLTIYDTLAEYDSDEWKGYYGKTENGIINYAIAPVLDENQNIVEYTVRLLDTYSALKTKDFVFEASQIGCIYDNDCDADCNECGAVREITHTYGNNCDADCNVCGETRTVEHNYGSDSYCDICGSFRGVVGTTGDCNWSLDGTVLTISGDGAMVNYSTNNPAPWGTDITEVIIGQGVTKIGSYAFYECDSLISVTIPDSVTSIASGAFARCNNLESITLPFIGGSATQDRFLGYIFGASSYVDNSSYVPSSLNTVVISDKCTSIGDSAFYNCSSLTCITIGNSVTSIGRLAFWNCYELADIIIPDSVTSIGDAAFWCCVELTSISISDKVTSIGAGAFMNCYSLAAINVDPNNTNYSSADGVLFNKDKTTLIVHPEGKTSATYTIPDSVTAISNGAFLCCTTLESIIIPLNVISIGENAFYRCESLVSITIPTAVTSIASGAFANCDNLTTVFYMGSETDRANISIVANSKLTEAIWYYNSCIGTENHTYTNNCDVDCNVCGATREIEHNFSDWNKQNNEYVRECLVCGIREVITINTEESINKTPDTNSNNASLSNSDIELIDKILTNDEQSEVASGAEVSIYLVVDDISDSVTTDDKQAIETVVENETVGIYLNIDLFKKVETTETQVTETAGMVTITVDIPEELINTNSNVIRTYKIVRVHDGVAEFIEGSFDSANNTYTFETDKFSTYAIVYEDELRAPTEWVISVTETGVYNITPSITITGFTKDSITVTDKNGKAVKYNDSKKGWPLVEGQVYTLKLNEEFDNTNNLNCNLTKRTDTIFADTASSENGGWYNDAVTYAVGAGLITGYGGTDNFGTSDNIQRQDFVVILARLAGVDLENYQSNRASFTDVPTGAYYEKAIMWAADCGITTGYADGSGKFGVGDNITREQLVTFLYRYAKYQNGGVAPEVSENATENAAAYADFTSVTDYAQEAVIWALENGVIKGQGGTHIAPGGNAKRCEVAQIIYNIFLNNTF